MANVMAGLSTPTGGESVNTDAGFEAALAGKGITKGAGDAVTSDTSVASGLEVVEPAQAREPNGTFAPADTPADTSQQGADTSTGGGTDASSEDPEVAAFLAKYGGDADKALKAAVEASKLIGTQGSELGKTREELAELRGRLDTLTQVQAQAPAAPLLSDEQIDDAAQTTIQAKGYALAATEAANHAHTTGDERLYRSVFELWNLEEPFNAQTHIADFRAWQRAEAAKAAAPPVVDPWVEAQKSQGGINETIAALAAERPDTWPHFGPHMLAAIEGVPKFVQELVNSSDPAERLEAVRLVADRATLLAGIQPPAEKPAEEKGMPESVARKLAGSSVASGFSTGSTQEAAQGATKTQAEEVAAFKKAILEAETTSVASGLTFGK